MILDFFRLVVYMGKNNNPYLSLIQINILGKTRQKEFASKFWGLPVLLGGFDVFVEGRQRKKFKR